MYEIPIYTAEQEIAELIKSNRSISFLSQLSEIPEIEITDKIKHLSAKVDSERKNFDLFPMQSILVSSVWNGNDDVFLPSELWSARKTAKDKPFNYEHNCDDIIGHMTNSYVIDKDGGEVEESTNADELPELIHIVSQAVLYKYWSKEELQERMDTILAEIKDNKWFVSVECLFPDFDYTLKDESGNTRLIARNKETSFLTKYLRIYGGTGVFKNEQVGRVPRKFILSGKGLVKKPANNNSIIFAKKYELLKNNLETAYPNKEVKKMDEKQLQEHKETVAKLHAEIVQLKASQNEALSKEWQAKVETANKAVEAATQEIGVLKASIEKTVSEKVAVEKQLEDLTKQKQEVVEALEKIESEKKFNERVDLCVTKLGLEKAQAETYVKNLSLLSSEAFASHVEFQVQFVSKNAKVEETVKTDTKVLEKVEKTEASVTVVVKNEDNGVEKICAQLKDYVTAQVGDQSKIKPKFQRA